MVKTQLTHGYTLLYILYIYIYYVYIYIYVFNIYIYIYLIYIYRNDVQPFRHLDVSTYEYIQILHPVKFILIYLDIFLWNLYLKFSSQRWEALNQILKQDLDYYMKEGRCTAVRLRKKTILKLGQATVGLVDGLEFLGFQTTLSRFTMIYHDLPTIQVDLPWLIMIYHDLPWFTHNPSRFTMTYHDLPWFTMVYHDLPWLLPWYFGTICLLKVVRFSHHGPHLHSPMVGWRFMYHWFMMICCVIFPHWFMTTCTDLCQTLFLCVILIRFEIFWVLRTH